MSFITCKLKSSVLQTSVEIKLFFPCDLPNDVGNEVKGVLTLLHGYSNNSDEWLQYTAAARYAADNGLVLIIPMCGNCFYTDMAYGGAYFTFLTQEMPDMLSRIFKIPTQRECNFIAGLSMGGYGALRIGLSRPDLYAACASFSGVVDINMLLVHKERPDVKFVFAPVFGDTLNLPDDNNLYLLAENAASLPQKERPRVLCTCGKQDYVPYMIRPQNEAFSKFAKELPLEYKYLEWDGVHEWNFWDKSLVLAIDFFLQNNYAATKMADWDAIVEEVL